METVKINSIKCRPIAKGVKDPRPIKGAKLFPELYANVYLCAKKKSGKTSVIFNILKHCTGRNTNIIAFVSTLHKDDGWKAIQEWCESSGHPFVGFTSLKEDGIDQLSGLLEHLGNVNKDITDEKSELTIPNPPSLLPPCIPAFATETKEVKEEVKERKEKTLAPEYILIFDDLSDELKSKSVPALLKKNRHFKAKVLISSQWLNDLHPESLKQMDNLILFGGHSLAKLEEIHKKCNLAIPLPKFINLYNDATAKPYNFLYVDLGQGSYRKNFDSLYPV